MHHFSGQIHKKLWYHIALSLGSALLTVALFDTVIYPDKQLLLKVSVSISLSCHFVLAMLTIMVVQRLSNRFSLHRSGG